MPSDATARWLSPVAPTTFRRHLRRRVAGPDVVVVPCLDTGMAAGLVEARHTAPNRIAARYATSDKYQPPLSAE